MECTSMKEFLKTGGYIRYIYDLGGNILGRIEVNDIGESRAYKPSGELLGICSNGSTYKPNGELIMQADVLDSLFFNEERQII